MEIDDEFPWLCFLAGCWHMTHSPYGLGRAHIFQLLRGDLTMLYEMSPQQLHEVKRVLPLPSALSFVLWGIRTQSVLFVVWRGMV